MAQVVANSPPVNCPYRGVRLGVYYSKIRSHVCGVREIQESRRATIVLHDRQPFHFVIIGGLIGRVKMAFSFEFVKRPVLTVLSENRDCGVIAFKEHRSRDVDIDHWASGCPRKM